MAWPRTADISVSAEGLRFSARRVTITGQADHLDLSRKPDKALEIDNEKEMLLIRVNSLENEVRKLKAKIEAIA